MQRDEGLRRLEALGFARNRAELLWEHFDDAEGRGKLGHGRIDTGRRPGLKSFESDPLLQARRRIKELETELKAVKAASALFEEGGADPKGSSRLSEG